MKRERLPLYLREVAQAFPDWLLDPIVLRTVKKNGIDVPDDLIEQLKDMHTIELLMGGVDRIVTVLRTCQTQDDWENIDEYLLDRDKFPLRETGFRLLRFPPPPFPDTPRLTALKTLRKYLREERKLGQYLHAEYRVRQGRAYVYHWSGTQEATVALKRKGDGPWTVKYIHPFDGQDVSDDTRRQIITALSEALGVRFAEHVPHEATPSAPTPRRFPPPLFPDTPVLTALTRARALKSEGYKMQNCCFNYVEEVRQGNSYFYHWSGTEEVTVALKRGKSNTRLWRILDLRTAGNEEPSVTTRTKIIAALAEGLGERFRLPAPISE